MKKGHLTPYGTRAHENGQVIIENNAGKGDLIIQFILNQMSNQRIC